MTDHTHIGSLMIVDDNAFDQRLNKRIVERSNVVNALVQFTDPLQALSYLSDDRQPNPDLILLDINMPVMDGFEFLERAVSEVGTDLCPVVFMLTTSLDPNDRTRALGFEIVEDFLNKPLTEDVLHTLCQRLSTAA